MIRILYIEDNSSNRKLVSLLLEYAGYEVVLARNGEEGVDAAARIQPGLILMDLQMPVMDGYEATRHIRALPGMETVPIIAVTADTSRTARENCRLAGCNGYIAKPINISTFAAKMAACLEKQECPAADTNDRAFRHGVGE